MCRIVHISCSWAAHFLQQEISTFPRHFLVQYRAQFQAHFLWPVCMAFHAHFLAPVHMAFQAHFLYTGNLVCQAHFQHTGQIEYVFKPYNVCYVLSMGDISCTFPDISCMCPIQVRWIMYNTYKYIGTDIPSLVRFTKCISNLFFKV